MRDDVASAARIVTFVCDLAALAPKGAVDRWDEVPARATPTNRCETASTTKLVRLVEELA